MQYVVHHIDGKEWLICNLANNKYLGNNQNFTEEQAKWVARWFSNIAGEAKTELQNKIKDLLGL